MKKLILIGSVLAISIALFESCGSTKEVVKESKTICAPGVEISYTNDIQPIIDNNCIRCHDASKKDGIGDLTNYASIKPYLESGRFEKLVLIKHSMPKGKKLISSDLDKIQCWKDGGYKE